MADRITRLFPSRRGPATASEVSMRIARSQQQERLGTVTAEMLEDEDFLDHLDTFLETRSEKKLPVIVGSLLHEPMRKPAPFVRDRFVDEKTGKTFEEMITGRVVPKGEDEKDKPTQVIRVVGFHPVCTARRVPSDRQFKGRQRMKHAA